MAGGLHNQPKIMRGAFVEYGLSLPPLVVEFQFNPQTISRARTATPRRAPTAEARQGAQSRGLLQLADARRGDFGDFRRGQTVEVNPETLTFEIRLDATDRMDAGRIEAARLGVSPQLATLELMMTPKEDTVVGSLLGAAAGGYAFIDSAKNPPVVLFVWGRKKVLPVNITSMQIREEEFSADLQPTRAVVTVGLEVIEGANAPFRYSQAVKESLSLLGAAGV